MLFDAHPFMFVVCPEKRTNPKTSLILVPWR
jgi:hypothetical protein